VPYVGALQRLAVTCMLGVTVSKYILIVDDSEAIRSAMRVLLERQSGIGVCGEAVDGLDALEKARYLSPDLIILDLAMPRMNGLQTARELRDRGVRAPIILFTMHADIVPSREALAAGVSAVVSKMNLAGLQRHIETLFLSSNT
jgi:DNA-binding NarL/FixJ family response regulator